MRLSPLRPVIETLVACAWLSVSLNGPLHAQGISKDDVKSNLAAWPGLLAPLEDPVQGSPAGPRTSFRPYLATTTEDGVVGTRLNLLDELQDNLFLSVQAPIKKGETAKTFVTLDGLATAASAEIGYRRAFWKMTMDDQKLMDVLDRYNKACGDSATSYLGIKDPAYAQQARNTVSFGPRFFLGGSAKVASQKFEYADSALALQDVSKVGFDLRVEFGVTLIGESLTSLSYRYQESYKAGKEAEACLPAQGTSGTVCRETTLGGPTRSVKRILTLEWRVRLGRTVGVAPAVSFDAESETWNPVVPFYFSQDFSEALSFAASIGYRSDEDEVLGQLYVTKGFSLFP